MDAVEHYLQAFALINPGPETPVGSAVDLDGGVGGCAQPAVVDQQACTSDPGVPAHLLVDRDLYLRAFRELDATNCF